MYKIYVGEISSDRQTDWFRKDENPYAVWSGKPIATEVCTIETLATADHLLRDGNLYKVWYIGGWKLVELVYDITMFNKHYFYLN